MRALRAIVVAGLLLALLCAVLGSIGGWGHNGEWAGGPSGTRPALPAKPTSGMAYRIYNPGEHL